MQVKFHRIFEKQLAKLPKKTRTQFFARLDLFMSNPHHPLLRRHHLSGEWKVYESINITGDVRAIFRFSPPDLTLFLQIGTHADLYA